MTGLLELLARELERPRDVSAQVVNHLLGTYGVDREAVGAFLVNELPKLEDYEIDLILAPLFTPTLKDQAIFAALLDNVAVPASQWPALVQDLVKRPTRAQLTTADGQAQAVPLREVTIERFVNRLRLDGTIPDALLRLLDQFPAPADRPVLKAVARRAIWESEPRRRILVRYLMAAANGSGYRMDDIAGLLKLAETYEPANLEELKRLLPHWLKVVQQEINDGASAKPFFNERVEELHGGGRDQRRTNQARTVAKEAERDFLERLQRLFND